MRVGTVVTLAEVGSIFSGEYYVTKARHFFESDTGYRTAFCVERPGIGEN